MAAMSLCRSLRRRGGFTSWGRGWPRRSNLARPAPRGGKREAGFSLVMLVMAVTVLSIMLAAALPRWSEMIRRDKEEELISRGFQYAEAIRLFQRRFQRYPNSLDELIKVKPRCIRQLWTDPMTANGRWTVIFLNQGSPLTPVAGLNPNQPAPVQPANGQPAPGNGLQPPAGNGLDPNGQELTLGPIVGVHSRSTQQSLLVFYGHEHYNEWEFRIEMLTRAGNMARSLVPNGGNGMALSTRWLGRPIESFAPTGNGLPSSALGPNAFGVGPSTTPPAQPPPAAGGAVPPG
jgi:type II secretory pathway pseudopilin PulG